MPHYRKLVLTDAQHTALRDAVKHHPKGYVREKASALLKVAAGTPAARVATAAYGLVPRDPDTLYSWMNRFEAEGVAGLEVKRGRGRKPAFSPSARRRRGGA